MFKKSYSVLLFCATVFLSFAVHAQGAENSIRIAVVNMEKVETSSVAWKSLSQQIDARREKLKTEIQSFQSTLQEKANNLESQRALLSPESFAIEVNAFKKERAAVDLAARTRKQALDRAFLEARGQIRKALSKVMFEFVKANKIALLLKAGGPNTPVLFVATNLTIDNDVLALLDKEIQTVTLPTETPAQ